MDVLPDGSIQLAPNLPPKEPNILVEIDPTDEMGNEKSNAHGFNKVEVTPSKSTVVTSSPIDNKLKYPTPFKNALFWPESCQIKPNEKKRKAKLTPTVAVSDEFIEYQKRVKAEKAKKLEIKENRKLKKHKILNDETDKRKPETDKISIGDYVVVKYEGEFFPGMILNLKSTEVEVKTMTMSGLNWKWPERDDVLWYPKSDTRKINPPIIVNHRGIYNVPDLETAKRFFENK